jgi:site-specific DNA-cytosine methylase
MRVLVACEFSQVVTQAFRNKGHDAFSCDILPTEGNPDWHIQGDVLDILNDGWDMMIAHPPCTHLAVSGAAWFKNKKKVQDEAISFFARLLFCTIEKICIENPVGIISTAIKQPTQIIQPYDFGEPISKKTCLWLKNLQPLRATCHEMPLFGEELNKGKFMVAASGRKYPEWCWNTGGGCGHKRSRFFTSIATVMAEQWG